jgi:hypothetical protein
MKLLLLEELTKQGISPSEIKKSLTLNYLGKTFHRKSDLPKKFKEKALNICKEVIDTGKESFIIETNYSYAIWEEETVVKENIKPKDSPTISEEISKNKDEKINDTSLTVLEENNKELLENTSSIDEKEINREIVLMENKHDLFQYTSREDRMEMIKQNNNRRISFQNLEEMEETKTYRGVIVNKEKSVGEEISVEEKTISNHKVKPRTYRGVAY